MSPGFVTAAARLSVVSSLGAFCSLICLFVWFINLFIVVCIPSFSFLVLVLFVY